MAEASEKVRALAGQAGLERALELAPEIVASAVQRGLAPLSKPPADLTPTTAPAAVFDPAAFERKR